MEMLKKNKQIVITSGIILVLVIGGFLITRGNSGDDAENAKDSILPNVDEIPVVDSSVTVELDQVVAGKEANLIVEEYPEGTESIEYTISYQALVDGEEVPRGAIGELVLDDATMTAKNKKVIIFGTESSGAKKYDNVVGDVTVELLFTGSYGKQMYTGDFEL